MSWEKEQIIILIMSTPETSQKYGQVVCTAGITENNEWRRLWSFTPQLKRKHKIHRWDIIEVKTQKTKNHRKETRKIDITSLKKIDSILKKKRKGIIEKIADKSIDQIIENKRSIGILKPNIKKLKLVKSITEDEKKFGLFFPKYHFLCGKPCSICSKKYFYHKMKCRDWGANVLCRKVKSNPNGKEIVYQKLFYDMKDKFDTYFSIGTHRRWHTWMIVGLFWFKK